MTPHANQGALFVVDGEQDLAGGGAVSGPVRSASGRRGDVTSLLLPRRREGALRACSKEAETLGCVPGRRYVVSRRRRARCRRALLDNIVDRAATHGASRIYLAHAGGAGFEDEPSTLLASLEERGFDARTASRDTSVGFESLDPFDVSLVEQELCSTVESFAPSARSTWSQTVVLDRSARGRRNAKPLDVGPAPVAAAAAEPRVLYCLLWVGPAPSRRSPGVLAGGRADRGGGVGRKFSSVERASHRPGAWDVLCRRGRLVIGTQVCQTPPARAPQNLPLRVPALGTDGRSRAPCNTRLPPIVKPPSSRPSTSARPTPRRNENSRTGARSGLW